MNTTNRAWAEVNLDSLKHNITAIRKLVTPSAKILGVVKADAYGHGYFEVASTLLENGADALAIACLDEALQLRKSNFSCPLLILGHSCNDEADDLVAADIIPACFDYSFAKAMSDSAVKQNKTAKIHIKTDTGMGRIGYRYTADKAVNKRSVEEILKISKLPNLEINGIFTHFSVADDDDDEYTFLQFERFTSLCSELEKNGLKIPIKHCANSAATVRFPHMHLDMVRPGIILYGHKPSAFTDCSALSLKPVMTFKAKISNIKTIESGASVSYGRRYTSEKPTKIATVPVGYADGYSRLLSNKAQILVNGNLCNIVGNICMDQCMIDVSDVNTISIGDEVILFGTGKNAELPVECLADKMGTINYEILCMVGKRVPRVYIENGVEKPFSQGLF